MEIAIVRPTGRFIKNSSICYKNYLQNKLLSKQAEIKVLNRHKAKDIPRFIFYVILQIKTISHDRFMNKIFGSKKIFDLKL